MKLNLLDSVILKVKLESDGFSQLHENQMKAEALFYLKNREVFVNHGRNKGELCKPQKRDLVANQAGKKEDKTHL